MNDIKKISETEIQVTKVVDPEVTTYSLDYLYQLRTGREQDLAIAQSWLDEVNGLIAQAEGMGIKTQAEVSAASEIIKDVKPHNKEEVKEDETVK